MKKRNIILVLAFILFSLIICFLIINSNNNKSRLYELDVNEVIDKLNNHDSFILLISQTNCSHCKNFKPKLKKISMEYKLDIYYIDYDLYSDYEKDLFKDAVSFDGSTPVTVFFRNGVEETTSNRIYGDVSSEKIIYKFKKNGFIDEQEK